MLFKKKALEEIGFFDETTFLGWEEYIIAEKFLQKRWETYFVPNSIIYHKVAHDTSKLPSVKKTMVMLESEKYFLEKFLLLPSFQRKIIKAVRIFSYALFSLLDKSYRRDLLGIIKKII